MKYGINDIDLLKELNVQGEQVDMNQQLGKPSQTFENKMDQ